VVVVVALVILAVVKPWGPVRPSPAPPEPGIAVATPPVVAPSAGDPVAPAPPPKSATPAFPCYWPTGWRVVVLDRELGWTVRTWIAVAPVISSSPPDRDIPRVSLAGSDPIAVGFCAPASGAEAAAWTDARPRIRQAGRLGTATAGATWRRIATSSLGDTGSTDLDAVRTTDGGAFRRPCPRADWAGRSDAAGLPGAAPMAPGRPAATWWRSGRRRGLPSPGSSSTSKSGAARPDRT